MSIRRVFGFEPTQDQFLAAYAFMKRDLFTLHALQCALERCGVPSKLDGNDQAIVSNRLADRLIQTNRKLGNLKQEFRGCWRWVKP